jgi:pyridoxamine 5'-phosphate oxidase
MALNDPIAQFEVWYRKRHSYGLQEPDACILATSHNDKPSNRVVLLKHYDDSGFVFVTNYRSNKAKEIAENDYVSLLFYWDASGRQIKITGRAKKATEFDSDAYFRERPLLSRVASWASNQSSPMKFRYHLLLKMLRLFITKRNLKSKPSWWGAYIIVPLTMEFFEHKAFRMNTRVLYKREGDKLIKEHLFP